ncbi:unnamed protein product [Arabis nemorensis]|uniref:NYN domain-containing protein n=1 Tax=Arabis nemorensis TaxID=586526 RepID=A0A565ATY0_9BRAS|nr:unnamed protein product [Arabis nemorensis]
MPASYAAAKTVVFWDIEDCKIPVGLSAGEVSKNIRTSLANKGYHGTVEIRAYGESRDDLVSTGIKLYHFPTENKDARDKQILVDVYFWAVDNPERANVMLIMGDISQEDSLITVLHSLKSENYNVLLAQHQNASAVLLTFATSLWLWASLSVGGMPIEQSGTSQSVDNTNSACSESSQNVAPSPTCVTPSVVAPSPTRVTPCGRSRRNRRSKR